MSPRLVTFGLFAALLSVGCRADQDRVTAFVGARIIDGTGASPIDNGVILVRAGRIVAVGRAGSIDLPANGLRVEVSGKTIAVLAPMPSPMMVTAMAVNPGLCRSRRMA